MCQVFLQTDSEEVVGVHIHETSEYARTTELPHHSSINHLEHPGIAVQLYRPTR
jgi:hypothetical protein